MNEVLFVLVFMEMGLILTLAFQSPVRKLLVMGLDRMKQGRGPLVAKTVTGTLFVVLFSTLYNLMRIQKRVADVGSVSPTDQVLLTNHQLEASLLGFSLFLWLVIDRLHYYVRELHLVRNTLEAVTHPSKAQDSVKSTKDSQTRSEDREKAMKRGRRTQAEMAALRD
ncbi:hypothetical protein NMG60_11037287 [Bertholletia excelsa]